MPLSEDDLKGIAQWKLSMMQQPKRGQVYRHYKGGLYSVVSVSIQEDTLEELVTYTSSLKGGDTTRPLANFTELVESPSGLIVPRFMRED
jgi:hypothetical protein